MLVCSVQIISLLDSEIKFQMFTLFCGRHRGVVHQHGVSIMGSVKTVWMGLTDNWQMAKKNNWQPSNTRNTKTTCIKSEDTAPQTGTIPRSGRTVRARFRFRLFFCRICKVHCKMSLMSTSNWMHKFSLTVACKKLRCLFWMGMKRRK